jgi:hypothetical protein
MTHALASCLLVYVHLISRVQAMADINCGPSSFPLNLTGLQCFDLSPVSGVKTEAECVAACCANPSCTIWNFSPDAPTSNGCSTWNNPQNNPNCGGPTGTWIHWSGGSRAHVRVYLTFAFDNPIPLTCCFLSTHFPCVFT